MKTIVEKPYLIFFLAIPIIMLLGWVDHEAMMYLNLLDEYSYTVPYPHLTSFMAMFFAKIGVGYWLMKKAKRQMSHHMNKIHVGVTVGGAILILILGQCYDKAVLGHAYNEHLTIAILINGLALLLVQLIFPINIYFGLFKKKKLVQPVS